MKAVFRLIGRRDQYEKIYGEFRLDIDKALATAWKSKPMTIKVFRLLIYLVYRYNYRLMFIE